MRNYLNLYLILIWVCLSSVLWAENKLYWQAVKINSHDSPDLEYSISVRVVVPGTKACSLKGPLMEDYISAEWFKGMDAWDTRLYTTSLSDLQQQSFGQWELKLIFDDDQESVYTFTISGSLEDDDFLPVPDILEPAHNASNIIAQNSTLRWNPNDANLDAHLMILEMTGEDFSYISSFLYFKDDISITQWNPGWLGLGKAYAKVGYVWVRNYMMEQLALQSGPVVNWDTATVFLVSGAKNDFTVKFSLDFNEDDIINLADLAIICSYWLDVK